MTSMETFHALVLSLPTRNSTLRMRVWRALKETGCGVLRDGVYLVPSGAADRARLARLESEIRSVNGFAMTLELTLSEAGQHEEVHRLFERSGDYGALVKKISAAKAASPRLGVRRAQTTIQRLQRAFDKLSKIDFYPGEAKVQAAEAMSALKRSFEEALAGGEPHPSRKRLRPVDRKRYRGRVWATRKNPWVDRLASAWLIKRFIDPQARFVWLEHPRDRTKRAVGFDFDGAEFTHVDNRVTFEVLAASFGLDSDEALAAIGAAVHFLDVGGIPVPDAKGLETVLKGIRAKEKSDGALTAEAIRVLDLFYSAYASKIDE